MTTPVMTRHARCEATLRNESVDRVPTYTTAISCEVASRLLGRPAHTGTGSLRHAEVLAWSRGEQAHAEFEAQMMQDLFDLHRLLDMDVFRMPWRMNVRPDRVIDENNFLIGDLEGYHEHWQYDPPSGEFASVERFHQPYDSPEAMVRWRQAHQASPEQRKQANAAKAEAFHAFCEQVGEEFYPIPTGACISAGISEFDLMALALEPEAVARWTMAQAEDGVELVKMMAATCRPGAILGGGDLAGAMGPMYSPQSFREVVLPAYQYAVKQIQELGVHYVFRSDGNLWPLMDMIFSETGCSDFGEADRDAGMSVGAVRAKYPEVVVWGNVSSGLVRHGSAAEVREQAKRCLEEAEGRGYFQGCSNAIVAGTPVENVLALYETR